MIRRRALCRKYDSKLFQQGSIVEKLELIIFLTIHLKSTQSDQRLSLFHPSILQRDGEWLERGACISPADRCSSGWPTNDPFKFTWKPRVGGMWPAIVFRCFILQLRAVFCNQKGARVRHKICPNQ